MKKSLRNMKQSYVLELFGNENLDKSDVWTLKVARGAVKQMLPVKEVLNNM